jgi:short-subunit dehydrogenase
MYRGKVIAITGGAGGIGTALARRFAQDGARIALLDRDKERLAEVGAKLRAAGHTVTTHACDVTDFASSQEAMGEVVAEHGRLDVLVNNAGLTQVSNFVDTEIDVYRRVMDVNFFGALHCTKAALDHLIAARGAIVVLSSIAGFAPLLARTGYCASKHALHGFFDTLRAELAGDGVHVMIVCPSFTLTGFARRGLDGKGDTLQLDRSMTGRVLTPEQVAEAIHAGLRRRRRLLVISRTGKAAWWVSRLLPARYDRIMRRRFRGKLWKER